MQENRNASSQSKGLSARWGLLAVVIILGSLFFLSWWHQENKAKYRIFEPIEAWKEADRKVKEKWGKGITDLQEDQLVIISPHPEDIRIEFVQGFQVQYALDKGRHAVIRWDDTGTSGSNAMLDTLLNRKARQEPSGADVVFGGGESVFKTLTENDLLMPLELEAQTISNIPSHLNGIAMYDPQQNWCGNVLGNFGIIYNVQMVTAAGAQEPGNWSDLGRDEYQNMLIFADPANSGTAAAIFEIIAQTQPDWKSGWKKLMMVLSNTKQIALTSSEAANAPAKGTAAISGCIDFYGSKRVAANPDTIRYIIPQGQGLFTPDPIAILKDTKSPQIAGAFVDFVLSLEGQSLWGLGVGHPDGPKLNTLYRMPIRRDFYTALQNDKPTWLKNPYSQTSGSDFSFDTQLQRKRRPVLIELVCAAAVENHDLMKQARVRLIDEGMPPEKVALFTTLPEDVDTLEKVEIAGKALSEPDQAMKVVDYWKNHFQTVYREILE